jgi:uncharacterized protein (TIGR02996 family)
MKTEDPDVLALEQAIERDPLDDATWNVYADLLDGRGDITGALIRAGLRPRASVREHHLPRQELSLLDLPEDSEVTWRRSADRRPWSLLPLPWRGLHLALQLRGEEDQRALAQKLEERALPRLWAFLQAITSLRPLEPALRDALAGLPLQRLTLRGSSVHKPSTSLQALPPVQHLALVNMPLLQDLSDELLLKTLVFEATSPDLGFLEHLPCLQALGLLFTYEPLDFTQLALCPRLQALEVSRWLKADALPHIARLPLRQLAIGGEAVSMALDPLASVPTLETLHLFEPNADMDLTPLSALPALARVEIGFCHGAIDLLPLAHLPSLRSLSLYQIGRPRHLAEVREAHPGLDLDLDLYDPAGE